MKKKIYIPVSVKDELPGKTGGIIACRGDGFFDCWYDGEFKVLYRNEFKIINSVTHWLKPSEDHFVFTEEELKTLLDKVHNRGWHDHNRFIHDENYEPAHQFIQQLIN